MKAWRVYLLRMSSGINLRGIETYSERSKADLPLSTLLPSSLPLPYVAAAASAAPPPTALEFAALKPQLTTLQKTLNVKDAVSTKASPQIILVVTYVYVVKPIMIIVNVNVGNVGNYECNCDY